MVSAVEYALGYASRGWRVFPVHTVVDGVCSCGSGAECEVKGKHPRTLHGVKDATCAEEIIRSWWVAWPTAGVGIATGRESGIVVIDIDPRNGGFESIEAYENGRAGGSISPGRGNVVITGSRGRHLYFKYPEGSIGDVVPGRANWLKGVDVKSDGGYVVAPPSLHVAGDYVWADDGVGDGVLLDLPLDVLGSIRQRSGAGGAGLSAGSDLARVAELLNGVPEGERDVTLFRQACRLRRKLDDSLDAVWLIIRAAAAACEPPFPEDEAYKKVLQAFKQDHADEDDAGSYGIEALSDRGNVWRFVKRYGNAFRYVPGIGWYAWDGARWFRDIDKVVLLNEAMTVPDIILEDIEAVKDRAMREKISGWAGRTQNIGRIKAVMELLPGVELLRRGVEDLDADVWSLNLRNGILDLRTGELLPHDPEAMHTKLVPVEFDREARCPEWLSFLEKVLPDADLREFIQRALGYSLTGVVSEKCMFILYGSGNNGKTLFLETVKEILGDYGGTASKSVFISHRMGHEPHPTDLASLVGLRMVSCAEEIDERDRLHTTRIKSITGGDRMKARFMRKDEFAFDPTFKLWLGTNHRPELRDFGDAMKERLRIVPFTVKVSREEQIPRHVMAERFSKEAAGILNWIIEGALKWQATGLTMPASMVVELEDYLVEEDLFGMFLEECIVGGVGNGDGEGNGRVDPGLFTTSAEIHSSYSTWCEMQGMRPWMNAVHVGRELGRRGFKKKKQGNQKGYALELRQIRNMYGL